ncbi:hypothetical protein JCM8097_002015 [Rhodosporidiobolus ruineniae]
MDRLDALAAFVLAHPLKAAGYYILLYALARLARTLYRLFLASYFSALREVPGPRPENAWWGNTRELIAKEPGVAHHEWTQKYGGAVRFKHLLGDEHLLLTDPVAINYVLNSNVDSFPKPPVLLSDIHMLLGGGIAAVDGDVHRRQRRIMAPAFTPGPLRAWVPMFFDLSYQLRDLFRSRIESGETDLKAWPSRAAAIEYVRKRDKDETVIDTVEWATRLTLDMLGKSAFGYDFNAMSDERNALAEALYTLFVPTGPPHPPTPIHLLIGNTVVMVMRNLHKRDWLKRIPTAPTKFLHNVLSTMETESAKIIEEKTEKGDDDPAHKKRDLLSIFNTPAASEAMTPDELRASLKTFVFAGHETVSTTLAWVLLYLARFPEVQARLRRELRTARRKAVSEGREELTADEVYNLPYLDAVMREVLRLEPAITSVPRIAAHDDLIPLATPIRSARDPSKTLSHLHIRKGQYIEISNYAANRSKAVFGEDADEFRPERWLDPERKIEGKVGVWGGMMTFLHGQRACIGWKFALYQMKTLLSVLVDDLEFAPRDADCHIEHRTQMIARPFVAGERAHGTKLPLRVRNAKPSEEEDGEEQ